MRVQSNQITPIGPAHSSLNIIYNKLDLYSSFVNKVAKWFSEKEKQLKNGIKPDKEYKTLWDKIKLKCDMARKRLLKNS